MIAVDSGVVVAASLPGTSTTSPLEALVQRPRLVAHAAVEAYSVLTRLPPPHRAQPDIVHAFIAERFDEPFLGLSEVGYQSYWHRSRPAGSLGGRPRMR